MSFNLTSPVTGAPATGFTAPTYTLTVDVAPSINGKQNAVTALGGTQTGVDAHSVSKPFTITGFRPSVPRTLPQANPITGVIKNVPVNTYKVITRKGMIPAVNQTAQVGSITSTINVPAGCDTFDSANVRAMLSAHIGALTQQAAALGDMAINGII